MASGGQWTPRAAARELQLPPAADEALVKKRYRELAKQLHPDRNKGNEAAATEAFQDHEMQTFLESMLSHCRIGDHAVVEHVNNFLARFRPAEGATASLSLAITIAYHHVATGRRVLAERTSMPITMDAAGEDETVLDIGTTTPEHCASGDSSVDATLTFAGLAIDQWAPEPVLLAIKDAAGTVSEDQVRVNSVAREDDGAAVGVEISGVDETGAEDIVDALVLDVSSADAASFSRLHRRRMGQLCTPSKRDRPAQADRSIFGS